jgi:hypothetical protein
MKGSNIGFALYGRAEEAGTLDARWSYENAWGGSGHATGGPEEGFAGRYHICYFHENGSSPTSTTLRSRGPAISTKRRGWSTEKSGRSASVWRSETISRSDGAGSSTSAKAERPGALRFGPRSSESAVRGCSSMTLKRSRGSRDPPNCDSRGDMEVQRICFFGTRTVHFDARRTRVLRLSSPIRGRRLRGGLRPRSGSVPPQPKSGTAYS